jgi:hypothetical protein
MEYPVIYEMEPIGVNGALEAVAIHWYCSESCRDKDDTLLGDTKIGMNGDYADGTVCERCVKPLT